MFQGDAGNQVWKWLNLSQFTNSVSESPVTFTVTAGNLVQTFQIGARENGFDMDKFVFGTASYTFTVTDLDAGYSGTPPPAPKPGDLVSGNLVQFSDNGAWCWYQDERALVDIARGKLLVGYIENHSGFGGTNLDGNVCVNLFDLNDATGSQYTLKTHLVSYGGGDDHNAPALLIRPDGKYLAIYAGHNNDDYSFWRIYDPATDQWSDEQTFDWSTQPGGTDFPTTYSNPFNMTAEGRTYDFSRGNGGGSPNSIVSTDLGNHWSYGGELTTNSIPGYVQGYFKYWGNGVDRIDFICTETHPQDYDTSMYHGFISNGMSFNTFGVIKDANIFDKVSIPHPQDFTPIFLAGTVMPLGQTNYRCWNDDICRYPDGTIECIISTRINDNTQDDNTDINPDHSFFFCRFDGTNWRTTYLGRAGTKLYIDQADYVGLGCLNPNDPNTIYISTPYDPRDNVTFLGVHEIFKGTTTDHGLTWSWTPITQNSTCDNLRPIMPAWDQNNSVLLWFRGTHASYSAAVSSDFAVTGIIDRHSETVEPMTYVDATTTNTILTDGTPLTTSDAIGQWHQRVGPGNGGSVLASADVNAETAPMIKTTATMPASGTYDVWVNFWGSPGADWRVVAGLSTNQLQVFRQMASQQVEPDTHNSALVLTNGTNAFLYQAYLGRVQLTTNTAFPVFVDSDALQTGTVTNLIGDTARTWYDGVSYAKVEPFQFKSVSRSGPSAVMLVWNSPPPEMSLTTPSYTVRKKNSLTDANWITLTNGMPSAGYTTTFTDASASGNTAFYRVSWP